VPQRRPVRRGSFGSHFDELVVQFPHEKSDRAGDGSTGRSEELQEKIDIHRLLFERAWQIDDKKSA
jgi:hypothetical protein